MYRLSTVTNLALKSTVCSADNDVDYMRFFYFIDLWSTNKSIYHRGGCTVADHSFALEGCTYFQQQPCGTEAGNGNNACSHQQHHPDWYARDVMTGEQRHIGKELPSEVNAARVTRDMLLPYIAATQSRLLEMKQALDRLHRGDLLTLADRVAVAACGFGAALVGGCPAEIYEQGEQLALDILRGVDPSEARVTGAYLRGADLSGAKLTGCDLSSADLRQAILKGANLAQANLSEAKLIGADLRGANLRGAKLCGADLERANLHAADLTKVDLRWADLHNADLSWANLHEADVGGADLADARLREANLSQAVLSLASLRRADLRAADLTEAHLRGTDLSKASLNEADLSRANLGKAILDRTNLEGALISQAQLASAQYLKDVILSDGSKYSVPEPWPNGF
jgi:uncharacterized protein YjbI with pentapeptide repeats